MKNFLKINSYLLLTAFLLGFSGTPALAATQVTGLYNANIKVLNANAKERFRAFPKALKQVLIKVTGNLHITQNPDIRSKLVHTSNYIQSYSYDNVTNSDQPETLYLKVHFNSRAIRKLLRSLNIDAWNNTRPQILIWSTVPNGSGPQIIGSSIDNNYTKAFFRSASNLGLPIILPDLDHQDLSQISTADIYNLNTTAINAASLRYNPDLILIGSIYQDSDQQQTPLYKSNWSLLMNGTTFPIKAEDQNINNLIQKVMSEVFTKVTASLPTNNGTSKEQIVKLHIANIKNLDEQTQAIHFLNRLSYISNIELSDIDPNGITLSFNLTNKITTLKKALIKSGKFVTDANINGANNSLTQAAEGTTTTYSVSNVTKNSDESADTQNNINITVLNYSWINN